VAQQPIGVGEELAVDDTAPVRPADNARRPLGMCRDGRDDGVVEPVLAMAGVDLGVDVVERVRTGRCPAAVEPLQHEAAARAGLNCSHLFVASRPPIAVLASADVGSPDSGNVGISMAATSRSCSVVWTASGSPSPISSQ
jgi:hypothetical protein